MAKQNVIRKKLPQLCYANATGWWFSVIPDPSHSGGRRWHYWSKNKIEARKLYRANIAQVVAEYGSRPPQFSEIAGAHSWALTDLAEQYYQQKKTDGCRISTLGNIKKYLPHFMKWLRNHGFDPAIQGSPALTTTLLAGYRQDLAEKKSIGRVEANHYIEQVRGMLTWGMSTHDLRPPALGAIRKFPKRAKEGHGRKQDRTPLTWAQIRKILQAADPVDTALILLGLNVGFGNMDIGVLKLNDVNLDKGIISDRRHKTGTPRDFVLWPETVAILGTYLAIYRGKPRNEDFSEFFFLGRQGNPMCWEYLDEKEKRHRSDAIKNRFDKLCKSAGVSLPYGAGFYILRHSYATLIGEESSDAREVQAAMAHSTIQQQDVYRHDRAMKAQAAQNRLHKTLVSKLPKKLLKQIADGDWKTFSARSAHVG